MQQPFISHHPRHATHAQARNNTVHLKLFLEAGFNTTMRNLQHQCYFDLAMVDSHPHPEQFLLAVAQEDPRAGDVGPSVDLL